jgi:hypothetical protein
LTSSRTKCPDCNYRYTVGRSPRCNPCRKKQGYDRQHNAHLKGTYGITIEDYYRMLASQGGSCAICNGGTSFRYLSCDHDHKTGEVRGLLCARCNKKLLPAAKNSVAVLLSAIDYLTDHPSRRVLKARDWSEYAD